MREDPRAAAAPTETPEPIAAVLMKLVVLDGPMRGQEFRLPQSPAVIGRDPGADVSLALDPRVSPFHCQILFERGQYWLEDLGSSPSTRVYGKPYDRQIPLFARDTFRIGNTRLCLLDSDSASDQLRQVLARHAPTPMRDEPPALPPAPTADDDPSLAFSITDPMLLTQSREGDAPEVQRVVTRLRVLQEITTDLAGKVDSSAILQSVLDRVLRVVRAERACAIEVAGDRGEAVLPAKVVRYRDGRDGALTVTPSRTVLRGVLRDRIAVLVDDVYADQRLQASQSLVATAYRSILCAPLLRDGKVTTVLYLDATEPYAFSREELELVVVIAHQAAAALDGARLYEELRSAYGDLETAHSQLLQTEKLATIGGLAASISHDIGNVITPITGVAAVILHNDAIDPELKEAFNRQMQRLKALASQLLSFSSPKPPDLVAVDLNAVVSESLLLVQTEARHHKVQIETKLAPELPAVSADRHRLDQAFVNIMLNAIQAMQATGGVLTISSGSDPVSAFLSFSDTGPGISEAHLAVLGKPFFTTKGRNGNGLGVYGCRRIVEEEHGGKLEIRSQLGKGATFTVRLPARGAVAGNDVTAAGTGT